MARDQRGRQAAGLDFGHHVGDPTCLIRVLHPRSCLGDESLPRNRADRMHLSYALLDAWLSFEPLDWLRIDGRGDVILHREPVIDRGVVQTGPELSRTVAFAGGFLRPISAVDTRLREERDPKTGATIRAGVQLELLGLGLLLGFRANPPRRRDRAPPGNPFGCDA